MYICTQTHYLTVLSEIFNKKWDNLALQVILNNMHVLFYYPRSFAAVWIRDTNLILVSFDENCNCSGVVDEVATMNGDPIVYILYSKINFFFFSEYYCVLL